MALHFFHCTDGTDLVLDMAGHDLASLSEIRSRAGEVAGAIVAAIPDYDEWDGWAVHVYDALGEIAIVPFGEAVAARPSLAPAVTRAAASPGRRAPRGSPPRTRPARSGASTRVKPIAV